MSFDRLAINRFEGAFSKPSEPVAELPPSRPTDEPPAPALVQLAAGPPFWVAMGVGLPPGRNRP